jgi:uncharacterized membrane protein YhfC
MIENLKKYFRWIMTGWKVIGPLYIFIMGILVSGIGIGGILFSDQKYLLLPFIIGLIGAALVIISQILESMIKTTSC